MLSLLINALFLVTLLPTHTLASVLAIDYGTDYIKASLITPGVPFDVLLNKDSKRKIQSSVAWKGNDRFFGADAFNLASRYPEDAYSSIKYILAAPYQSPAHTHFSTISTASTTPVPDRHTIALRRSDPALPPWSVEELVAMQLSYIKDLADSLSSSSERVVDAILTVPPYFSQYERDAIVDAIEIAGMRTLALINDGTAVAVNYAMTRSFPEDKPEYHIIYDAGASSVRATLVGFSTVKPPSAPPHTAVDVLGVGYDREAGGTELDRRLREMLLDAFAGKHKRDLRGDKRAMAKLWKESGRIKSVLSANSETVTSIESLAYDIDFTTKVTRKAFEEACGDLRPKFVQPIWDALHMADLSLSDISSVILTGGSSRTPMIQTALKAAVGESKIAQNVNADEAAVLGAALHGASLSRQFKTKDIRVSDIALYDVQVSYLSSSSSANSSARPPRTIHTVVFPAGSKTGTKKTLTFKRKEDFSVRLEFRAPPAPGSPTGILEVGIAGVADAMGNLTERGVLDPVVKANMTLSESGFVSLGEAVAFGEMKDDSLAGKLKSLFAGAASENKTVALGDEGAEAVLSTESVTAALKDLGTIRLTTSHTFQGMVPMTAERKRAARERLRELDREETVQRRREEARNTLEGYLYRMRDLLSDPNPEAPFKKCSQEEERRTLMDKVEEIGGWLAEKGDVAETSQFWDKRNIIESLERPIVYRYQEIEAFPHALNMSQMWNWSTRLFLTEAHQNLTADEAAGVPPKWTREELASLEKTLKEHERWLGEWVDKQRAVKMNEDPVITTTEMKARAKTLEMQLQKLVKRKVPPPSVRSKKEGAKSATDTSAATAGESETTAGSETTTTATTGPSPGPERHVEL